MSQTSRIGVRWSEEEEIQLLEEIQDFSIEDIAIKHKRTICGIASRLKKIGYNMYLKNEEIDKIVSVTKINEKDLLDFFNNNTNKQKKENYDETSIMKELKEIKEQLKQLNNNLLKVLSKKGE